MPSTYLLWCEQNCWPATRPWEPARHWISRHPRKQIHCLNLCRNTHPNENPTINAPTTLCDSKNTCSGSRVHRRTSPAAYKTASPQHRFVGRLHFAGTSRSKACICLIHIIQVASALVSGSHAICTRTDSDLLHTQGIHCVPLLL